jgi:hypothetical protein
LLALSKLSVASKILSQALVNNISIFEFDEDLIRLKIVLKNNVRVYIQYNNYLEYSYVIIFSKKENDRIIIDNFDDQWPVSSSPHHIHHRFEIKGEESDFRGNPETDMDLLLKLIES